MLHLICPLGAVATTAAMAVAEPVGLTPIFYLWPMLVAAYFLPRREIAANFAFTLLTCGIALSSGSSRGCAPRCSSRSR